MSQSDSDRRRAAAPLPLWLTSWWVFAILSLLIVALLVAIPLAYHWKALKREAASRESRKAAAAGHKPAAGADAAGPAAAESAGRDPDSDAPAAKSDAAATAKTAASETAADKTATAETGGVAAPRQREDSLIAAESEGPRAEDAQADRTPRPAAAVASSGQEEGAGPSKPSPLGSSESKADWSEGRQTLSAAEAAAQAAMDRGAQALLAVMKQEENPFCYVFPPVLQRKLDRYDEVEQRFSPRSYAEPIYKYQYETVTVNRAVKEGTRTVVRAVQERRIVGREQVGTKQVEHMVPDPNGSVVQKVRRPVYGPGGPDQQPVGWLGNNAMALVALVRCGVRPQQEPALQTLASRLAQYLDTFGVPDSTWDIAWSLIAFVEYPDNRHENQLERLFGRLLAGQIAEGPGKGLWGPVCVNPEMLRRAADELARNQAALSQLGPRPAAPGQPAARPAAPPRRFPQVPGFRPQAPVPIPAPVQSDVSDRRSQLEDVQERLFREFRSVSVHGPRFVDATQPAVLPDEHNAFGNSVEVAGWPVNVYRELTGDLESTALAAYALRVCSTRHVLPATIDFPRRATCSRQFNTREALAAALAAVGAAQREDGSWDEMVVWQPVREFQHGGEGQFGPVVDLPASLPSQATPIATAQACDAMEDLLAAMARIHEAKSPAKARPVKSSNPEVYREQIAKGRRRLLELVASAKDAAPTPARTRAKALEEAMQAAGLRRHSILGLFAESLWGGIIEPYALLCQLRLEQGTGGSTANEADHAAADRLVATTIQSQTPSGLWWCAGSSLPWTPSLRERAFYQVESKLRAVQGAPAQPPAKKPAQGGGKPRAKAAPDREPGEPAAPKPGAGHAEQVRQAYQAFVGRFLNSRFWRIDHPERLATVYMLRYLNDTTTGERFASETRSPPPAKDAIPQPTPPQAKETER